MCSAKILTASVQLPNSFIQSISFTAYNWDAGPFLSHFRRCPPLRCFTVFSLRSRPIEALRA